MKHLPLHWKIIIGMVLGVVFGLIAISMGWDQFTSDWIKPFGTIFINLLKLIAVPLVFASLIKGVASLSDISKLSRIGSKTIALYLVSTVLAVTTGLLIVNTLQPGKHFSEEKIEFKEKFASKQKKMQAAAQVKDQGLCSFGRYCSAKLYEASTNNKNMLQVIFLPFFLGLL